MNRKLPFLSLFFIVLGATLAVAVTLRIRSHQAAEGLPPIDAPHGAATSTTSSSAVPGARRDLELPVEAATGSAPRASVAVTNVAPVDVRLAQIERDRQQRYNELLRAGAPAANNGRVSNLDGMPEAENAPAAPAKEPSLIKRVVDPIANTLGVRRPETPQTQQPPVKKPETQKPPKPQDPSEPPDPESDVTPPQLLTIEFTPAQVKDGEVTVLSTQVSDDLSGVATVSGVIASPTGGLQGFACQREGETNHYVAQIKVPADAAEGVWKVNYLTLADNARNSINLSAAQGMLPPSAQFRVTSSNSDSTGPSLKAVWLDRIAMRAGERNTLFVQAEDEKSGVQVVSGVLLSPSKNARIGFGCQLNGQGAWECPITPPTCLDCGLWSLEQLQVQDKASNMTTFRGDNAMVKQVHLDIGGDSCDSQPPQLSSVILENAVVSNTEANTVVARAVVTDDMCGVANLSGQAAGPGTGPSAPRLYFSFERQGDQWVARISVPKHAARGVWRIVWIQVLDAGHNLKAYSERDPALAGVSFRVQ